MTHESNFPRINRKAKTDEFSGRKQMQHNCKRQFPDCPKEGFIQDCLVCPLKPKDLSKSVIDSTLEKS